MRCGVLGARLGRPRASGAKAFSTGKSPSLPRRLSLTRGEGYPFWPLSGIPTARSSPQPTRGHSHRWTPKSHVRGSSLRILRRPTLVGGQGRGNSHTLTVSENASNRKSLQNFPRRNSWSGRKKDRHPLVQRRRSAKPARFDLCPMRQPTALGERFVAEDA